MNSGVASMIVRQAFRKRAGKVLSRVRRSKKDPSHTMPFMVWIDETADETITPCSYSKAKQQLKFLASYVGSGRKAKEAMICATTKCLYGFMAYLNKEQFASICKNPHVVSVSPSGKGVLTFNSFEFKKLEKDGVEVDGSLQVKGNCWEDKMINSNVDTDECSDSDSEDVEGFVPNASKCATNARVPSDREVSNRRIHDP